MRIVALWIASWRACLESRERAGVAGESPAGNPSSSRPSYSDTCRLEARPPRVGDDENLGPKNRPPGDRPAECRGFFFRRRTSSRRKVPPVSRGHEDGFRQLVGDGRRFRRDVERGRRLLGAPLFLPWFGPFYVGFRDDAVLDVEGRREDVVRDVVHRGHHRQVDVDDVREGDAHHPGTVDGSHREARAAPEQEHRRRLGLPSARVPAAAAPVDFHAEARPEHAHHLPEPQPLVFREAAPRVPADHRVPRRRPVLVLRRRLVLIIIIPSERGVVFFDLVVVRELEDLPSPRVLRLLLLLWCRRCCRSF
mmetsp:Transcript_23698/g.76117  ORF Transcript_23698/g.76117 Transcript_23698/m.76117 type:complete len:308 (-) Transcript_23698:847-1770(-)